MGSHWPGLEAFMPPVPGCPFCNARPRTQIQGQERFVKGRRIAGYQFCCGTWKPLGAPMSSLEQSNQCKQRVTQGFTGGE